ncbi:MAG TPA: hypothetical protein VE035_17665 [Puia sp.]|nr:hypothetical protein [Puia sp.]
MSFEKSNKVEKMLIEANPQYKTINIYSWSSRGPGKTPPRHDQGAAEATGQQPGKADLPEEKENMEDRGEMKEEELEFPGGKPPTKKRSYK